MAIPRLDGRQPTQILCDATSTNAVDEPVSFWDLFIEGTFNAKPPWMLLCAGTRPRFYRSRVVTSLTFDTVIDDIDWVGFELFNHDAFSIALVHQVAGKPVMGISLCSAEISALDLVEVGGWHGAVSFKISRVRNLDDQAIGSVAAAEMPAL